LGIAFGSALPVSNARKPPNNGTLVLFHVPENATVSMLEEVFGQFGEIREIREPVHRTSQRFVEYWDTRDSQKARKEMNGVWLFGVRMSIDFSLPGGWRRDHEQFAERAPKVERRRCGALQITRGFEEQQI
jgi:RNA recognition motif-containing protein